RTSVVHHDRGSIVTEQYRAVRTQILARCKNRRLQIHVLTSAAPGEGKTISTLNLGMAFSEIRNQKTLLLEADLRRPTFATYFGRPSNPGLTEYLRHQTDDIDAIVHDTVYDNLQYIAAGEGDPMKSTELLSSPRMLQLLDRLRDRYDFIFIDTPPVVTVTDPCILGSIADQTILVVRLNKTASQVVDRAKRLLRASNCEVAGVILTHLSPDLSRYGYRYTYGYTSK
ncbi:MAG: CpsD/CapB family tyrosine-protein kinase, partial [Phycisphaerales bacterium]|nr:CpsD/CapB family tyrosine-protein kinase [Phycisphaerales bacterium]